ncbi:YmdB family metallophosphoesterase [Treponema pedis]|uniref:Ser/Thr protein phosphatase family protein n=2 Tax=Treponema pedis TaxID=409322 RepID=S6A2U8_9SPIR|nr:YmdB family metallophosphoesterase [Treponema pedis]AGT42981.1 Ser/Thr protein phosphatase family protein [Treponema pedis str. T A4]QOW61603.1 YmdB family metallophosphoesterase [Treponema pedis]QSI03835.1 YmdB family metallophosphoesterase [Treponema pedis]
MKQTVKIFMGGDVCGQAGLNTLKEQLPKLIKNENIDFCVVNGENTANGIGIRDDEAEIFFNLGVDVITGGNHTLERFDIRQNFGKDGRVLRPHNFPVTLGSGVIQIKKNGISYIVINLQGRENMRPIECPFKTLDSLLCGKDEIAKELRPEDFENSISVIDFHAESTAEKEALGFYADGKITVFGGTHTHTQTADERMLPKGTAYITDVGMIGAKNSVIGGSYEAAIFRATTQVPQKAEMNKTDELIFCGIITEVDVESKKAVSIKRISILNFRN